MERKIFPFTTREAWLKERSKVLTSTDIGTLFGVSSYSTPFELHISKANGDVKELEPNDRMFWGDKLERAIAEGIAETKGWHVQPMKEFISIPSLRLGSSFDFRILAGDVPGPDDGILEIKNVDSLIFRDGWIVDDDGEIEAPPAIEAQLQNEMLVAGLKWGFIGALVGGNQVKLLERKADPAVHKAILSKVSKFWDDVDNLRVPAPDYVRDAEFLVSLYQSADEDSVVESNPVIDAWAEEYRKASEEVKSAEAKKLAAKAHLLQEIGEAGKVIGPNYSISAKVTRETVIESFTRKAFRNMRVTFKKGM